MPLVAVREVLHVHERAPAAGAIEEGCRIDARVPGPAEVELEEDVIPGQQLFQEAASAFERSDLAVVIVKAEPARQGRRDTRNQD